MRIYNVCSLFGVNGKLCGRLVIIGLNVVAAAGLFLSAGNSFAQNENLTEKFRVGTTALRDGNLDEAAKQFESITRLAPKFAEARLNLGLVREEQGRFEDAVINFNAAVAIKPRMLGAHLFLGIAEYRLNHANAAIEALNREIALNPSDANAWMWLGVVQLGASAPEDAVKSLDKAVTLAPENVDILYHRGRAHLLVSKNSYEQMFKNAPHSWRVHQVLAQAYSESDRHAEAIAEYQSAIKLVPQQPGLHEALAIEYREAGQLNEAEAEYRAELQIDSGNTMAEYKLGTLKVERGTPLEGKAMIESAMNKNPNLKDSYYYLGRAEMQLNQDEKALESFKRAVASDSEPEIIQQSYYQQAIIYRRLHRTEEAQVALEKFEKLKQEASDRQQQLFDKKRRSENNSEPDNSTPINIPN